MSGVLHKVRSLPENILKMPDKESRINSLSEPNFWGIIHESLVGSKGQKTQSKLLIQLVSKLSEKEMIGFHYHFWRCFFNSYLSEIRKNVSRNIHKV